MAGGRKAFYVLPVSCQYQVFYAGARRWAVEIAKLLAQKELKRLSAGVGTKGERLYDWALLPLQEDAIFQIASMIRPIIYAGVMILGLPSLTYLHLYPSIIRFVISP